MTEGPASQQRFEDAMKRLAEIVARLESGELSLEESLVLFEEGIALSRLAQTQLEAAKKRVEQLVAVDTQGKTKTTPL